MSSDDNGSRVDHRCFIEKRLAWMTFHVARHFRESSRCRFFAYSRAWLFCPVLRPDETDMVRELKRIPPRCRGCLDRHGTVVSGHDRRAQAVGPQPIPRWSRLRNQGRRECCVSSLPPSPAALGTGKSPSTVKCLSARMSGPCGIIPCRPRAAKLVLSAPRSLFGFPLPAAGTSRTRPGTGMPCRAERRESDRHG